MKKISSTMKSLLATLSTALLLNAALANPVLAMNDQDIQMQGIGKSTVIEPVDAVAEEASPSYALPIAIGAYAVLVTAGLIGVAIGWGVHHHTPCNTTNPNSTEPICTDVVEYAHQCKFACQCFINATGYGPSYGF